MVITSPFGSIKGFIVSKPPLVLFTLCLMGFAITTFSFAYYVEHTEKMPNLDAHRDLVSFLSHLGKRKLCISSNDESPTKNALDIDNFTTINVKAKLKLKHLFPNMTYVQGYIPMSDWISECLTISVDKVQIMFVIPSINTTSDIESDVCVSLSGPVSVLASAINSNQCTASITTPHAIWGHIHKSFIEKNEACSDDKINPLQVAELTYVPDKYNGVSLTTHDRSVINLHLFHTSYFLLVMAITLICYAMIKGKPITKHQSLDKIPLDV